MAISLKGTAGAWAAGTTAASPTIPTHAAGDLIVVHVEAKPTLTATPPVFSTPAGWAKIGEGTNASGAAQGADAGQTWHCSYYLIATGSSHTISVTVTNGNVTLSKADVFQKTSGSHTWVTPVAVSVGDTTSAASYALAGTLTVGANDMIVVGSCLAGNNQTYNATWTLAATGMTFGSVTKSGADGTTNNGNDLVASACYALITAGTSASVTVTASNTLSGAQTGTGAIIRLRETAPVTATMSASLGGLTATSSATPSKVASLAAPLGALSATTSALVTVPATFAAPLGSLTATTAALVTVPASFTASLGALTATLAGTVSGPSATINATLAAPLGALTAGLAATPTVHALLAAPLGGLTASATGVVTVHATWSAPLGPLSAAVTATVRPQITATLSAVLGSLTATTAATPTVHATFSAPLGGLVAGATATIAVTAVFTAPLGTLTATLAGVIPTTVTATMSASLGSLTAVMVAVASTILVIGPTTGRSWRTSTVSNEPAGSVASTLGVLSASTTGPELGSSSESSPTGSSDRQPILTTISQEPDL